MGDLHHYGFIIWEFLGKKFSPLVEKLVVVKNKLGRFFTHAKDEFNQQ